jgi:hypothetical protein
VEEFNMKRSKALCLPAAGLALVLGCSETTKTETKEALKETGEAINSAAQDTKENAAKAATAVEEGARKVHDKLSGEPTERAPETTPSPGSP